MKIYEIGTGYTSIPSRISAATEIVVENLTHAFMAQNVPVEVIDIAANNRPETDLPICEVMVPRMFSGTDVQLGIMHKLKRVVYSIMLAGTLKRIIKESEDDVVLHFHNQYNLFFFYKLTSKRIRQKCLIAYTNHSGIWRLPWEEIQDIVRKRYFQERECMQKADLVFVLNEETEQNIIQHLNVPRNRIVTMSNGVNTDVHSILSAAQKQEARAKWNLADKCVILQIGSVYENKGQLRSVENLLPMLKKDNNLVYAYAGGVVDKEYHQRLQKFAEDNGVADQVRYLGMLSPGEAVNELYNAAHVSICASKYEAFSLTIMESLASGVPVLIPEETTFAVGEGCLKFRPDTLCAVVDELITMEQPAYEQLSRKARSNAAQNYSWSNVASAYLAAFQNKVKENV